MEQGLEHRQARVFGLHPVLGSGEATLGAACLLEGSAHALVAGANRPDSRRSSDLRPLVDERVLVSLCFFILERRLPLG
jgi:hypothetical protein